MLKVITTRYGQLVAKVNKEAGETQILNGDMQPVATIKRVTKEDVVRSINQIARFLSMKDVLEQLGIVLAPGAFELHSIDTDSFTDEEETLTAQPEAGNVAAESQPEPLREMKSPGKQQRKGAKRGRKPGQKVKRNPELAW